MKISIFPLDYENQLKAKEKKQISDFQSQQSIRLQNLREEFSKCKVVSVFSGTTQGLGAGVMLGLIVGGILSIFFDDKINGWLCFITGIVSCSIAGGVSGYRDAKRSNKRYADCSSAIYNLQASTPKLIQEMKNETDRKIKMYYAKFEEETKKVSTHFADSQLMNEVVNWMTEGFTRIIDAADRRRHVEQINIPFLFKVFTNKITCNLGVYDFELQRCRDLTSPVEQAAMAKAIASALQLNIIMKYPEDKSGTKISIKINYSFSSDCPATTITYVAPNGNYKSIRDW